jgi:putative flippase GtrA
MAVRKLRKQVFSFAAVGGIGFLVDAAVLTLLSVHLGVNVFLARVVSFAVASLATWLLNRRHTFERQDAPGTRASGEYLRYMSVQAAGALINLGVFSAVVALQPSLLWLPVVPLAIGSTVAMIFNFCGARFWIYRH